MYVIEGLPLVLEIFMTLASFHKSLEVIRLYFYYTTTISIYRVKGSEEFLNIFSFFIRIQQQYL